MTRRIHIETFGCQMNELDTELVGSRLVREGFALVESPAAADIVLFNTCSVREHAEQKVWSRLGELRERKAAEPGLVIGLLGCMAQRDGLALIRKFPHLDVVCSPPALGRLPSLLKAACGIEGAPDWAMRVGKRTHYVCLMDSGRELADPPPACESLESLDLERSVALGADKRAYIRVTTGCNKFCSFCVVPFTRGKETHRPHRHIIDEARRLADAGAVEITLLGQTINHYVDDTSSAGKVDFADLLHGVHEAVPHLRRLRFLTSYPRDFTRRTLEVIRDCNRVCRYIHLPVQSGSDRVLARMNRGYTRGEYMALVASAREIVPDVALASDFIVGFPGEEKADHQASLSLIREAAFKNSYIFKYSPRPGTVAAKTLADDVPEDTKKRRNQEMLTVQNEVSGLVHAAMVGRTEDVLVDAESRAVDPTLVSVSVGGAKAARHGQLSSRTRYDHLVVFDGPASLIGTEVRVRILRATPLTLFAERLPQ